MKWARFDNGFCVEIIEFNPEGKYHPEIKWYKVPPDIENYRFFKLDKNGKVVVDLEKEKVFKLVKLNQSAKDWIRTYLFDLDWGSTYEECLAELNSSAQVRETKILYLLKPHKPDLTLTEVKQKIAEYLAGTYTKEDATQEAQKAGLSEEEIQKYISLLNYAAEVQKLLNWVEDVWDYEEQKEREIKQASTVEELEQIEIKFPELT